MLGPGIGMSSGPTYDTPSRILLGYHISFLRLGLFANHSPTPMTGEKPRNAFYGLGRRMPVIAAAAAVVLALSLGLGLGLGLKHHHSSVLPLLTSQTSNNHIVGSIVGQSPQDRTYNFTIALANGAPDGVNKTMLVVNGTS